MNPEPITSQKNPLLKEIRKAVAQGGLTDRGLMVAETRHLLDEALRSGRTVEAVLIAESHGTQDLPPELRTFVLPDALFREVAATQTPQGIIALVRPVEWGIEQVFAGDSLVIVLDGVQEPGNAGTILRSAEAFGATGAVFLKGTVDLYNPKAVRASAGSTFRLPCVAGVETAELMAAVEQNGALLYAALPASGETAHQVDLRQRCAIVIGSEARGVSRAIASKAVALRIPTTGVESLNASVAAGVLLYEARRQRMQAP